MANDPGWQRRSDEWVKMLDQSRLRKEKRLADKKALLKLTSRERQRIMFENQSTLLNGYLN